MRSDGQPIQLKNIKNAIPIHISGTMTGTIIIPWYKGFKGNLKRHNKTAVKTPRSRLSIVVMSAIVSEFTKASKSISLDSNFL